MAQLDDAINVPVNAAVFWLYGHQRLDAFHALRVQQRTQVVHGHDFAEHAQRTVGVDFDDDPVVVGVLVLQLLCERRVRGHDLLARVAQRQKLFGQSIRYTKKALLLEPNDRDAIAIQGEAMVELGALARAKENLAKLQKLCPSGCTQLAELSATITRGPTVASAKPPEVPKSN